MARLQAMWLRDRRLWAPVFVILCGIVAYFVWFARHEKEMPITAQVMAREAAQLAEIAVGPNVQVSAANGTFSHREIQVAADPTDPRRLFSAAIFFPYAGSPLGAVSGYRSEDGGKSWQASSFPRKQPDESQFDLSVAFGPDGILYLVFRTLPKVETRPVATSFRYFRSTDVGKTWAAVGTIDGGEELDRPYLAVDSTSGPYCSRLYCASFYHLHTSADQGETFSSHRYAIPKYSVDPMPSNPVVLSDGTVILAFLDWRQDLRERPGLGFLTSDDGGRSLRELPALTARWRGEPCNIGKFWFLPRLAVGKSGGPFRDRLYAVWEDGNGPLRVRILFAHSNDKGRSWIGPTILSEQPADGSSGYGAHMPELAVNQDGVVAVSWYDRRGLPDVKGNRDPQYGAGCNVRVRLSLDGGTTWQPSVRVNEKPIRATVWELRDNAGLTADSSGVFHPHWIDDRTGVLQVWTAAVKGGQK
jgi:hypothetical protein